MIGVKVVCGPYEEGANNRPYTAEWAERLADLAHMTRTSFDTAESRKQLTHAKVRIGTARLSISIASYLYRESVTSTV